MGMLVAMSACVGKTAFQMVKSWLGGWARSRAREAARMAWTVAPGSAATMNLGVLSRVRRRGVGTVRMVSLGCDGWRERWVCHGRWDGVPGDGEMSEIQNLPRCDAWRRCRYRGLGGLWALCR